MGIHSPFNNAYTEVMQPWQKYRRNTDEVSPARALGYYCQGVWYEP